MSMNDPPRPVLKKPKIEKTSEAGEEKRSNNGGNHEQEDEEETTRKEQEEALVALIEHRTKEVEHLRHRISYYTTQLDQAENRLEESKIQLARIRGRHSSLTTKAFLGSGTKEANVEERSCAPLQNSQGLQNLSESKPQLGQEAVKTSRNYEGRERGAASPSGHSEYSSKNQHQSKPKLVIPSIAASSPRASQLVKTKESGSKVASSSGSQQNAITPTSDNISVKVREDRSYKVSPKPEVSASQTKAAKRIIELKEHKELIPLVRSSSSPITIRCHTGSVISSQHKRKLRSLILCPTNDQLFATSALDGIINLWQVQGKGSSANLLSTTDCSSAKQRRWPEDIAWHPQGDSLFSVYSADNGDSQISILNLNKTKEGTRVSFLEQKPHLKGIINSITFMPWKDTRFVTGGSDHAVFLWSEKDGENPWKHKVLHRSMHSSAVMGVAGLQQKTTVLSVGADKRIVGFDVASERAGYKHQIESKCMSVVPNPCDFNLFMVQTGTPERQLRLFDIRLRNTELHAFGWKQESSDSQSALINQAWSPDGLYISSGSADPVIHVFDIRFNSRRPSQSIKAHQKRVFKAVWHHALPLLISISSDLNIGLHKTY
ncbi:uncharacterized protein [Coffea arabica]|uniref:Uncharacterized protein n=1 Tax=Coffea arabica TaxID=13443 RepID=A0A6P6X1T8_COFAR|nr:uncharacterized protein LOC113738625 isoform X1 [Coffea arabica]